MKKIISIIFLIALLFPFFAYAEPCADIEYAELKDMSQESFMKEHCRVVNLIRSNLSTWQITNSRRDWKDMESCKTLSDKTSRIYLERFKVKIDNTCGRVE